MVLGTKEVENLGTDQPGFRSRKVIGKVWAASIKIQRNMESGMSPDSKIVYSIVYSSATLLVRPSNLLIFSPKFVFPSQFLTSRFSNTETWKHFFL